MAKKSMIEREKKRQHLVDVYAAKRAALKEIISNQDLPVGERLLGTLAATAVSAMAGARVYRVHQVGETRQVVDMAQCRTGFVLEGWNVSRQFWPLARVPGGRFSSHQTSRATCTSMVGGALGSIRCSQRRLNHFA